MDRRLESGAAVRAQARAGLLTGPTCGLAPGLLQANLVIVPQDVAADFRAFCERNPKPCPILEVIEPGRWEPTQIAPGADLRTDVPRYRVYRKGVLVEEPTEITRWWRDDLVAFLLGCSLSFESAMQRAGLPVRHIDEGRNVPMYRTNLKCTPAGVFSGPLVVTMRPLTPAQAIETIVLTSRYPLAHGAPVHFGDPQAIGIADLGRPDFGDAVTIHAAEVPVFWACGVTTQVALAAARLDVAITHSPGCMFVTDRLAAPEPTSALRGSAPTSNKRERRPLMIRSFTPAFQHFQKDIESLLKSEGKCEKNEHGQLVFRGYQDALDRMYRTYMEHEAYAPLVADLKRWNWEWGFGGRLEELTARLREAGDWPLLAELWASVVAKRRTNYNKTKQARRAVPDDVSEELVEKTRDLLLVALYRLRDMASELHKDAEIARYAEMIAKVEQRKHA